MIKIETIESLDGVKSQLYDLRNEFYQAVNSSTTATPLERINNALTTLTPGTQQDILSYCRDNYNDIIIGTPDVLTSIVSHFDSSRWTDYLTTAANRDFRNTMLDLFGYRDRFRVVKAKGVWFAHKLNIKACPYCNAQFTITVRENGNPKKAKFQFDHFFNKSSYPHLSVSMYNLIPSCAGCNLTKSGKMMSIVDYYHPYESSIMNKMKFVLDNESILRTLLLNEIDRENLKTSCEPVSSIHEQFVKDHCELYDIEGVYANHSDYAEEILMKALMYPPSKKVELMKIKGLFNDEATFKRYLIGNYPDESDILKRPLAKFTQDIARQLKLIE